MSEIKVDWSLAPDGAEELVQYMTRITWRKGIKIWCAVSGSWCDYVSDWKTIATSPQTKTVADEQEGEKWTHFYNDEYCKIVIETPDKFGEIVIDCEYNGYITCEPSELKPIKPKLTKAEAWDKMSHDLNPSLMYQSIMECYDII